MIVANNHLLCVNGEWQDSAGRPIQTLPVQDELAMFSASRAKPKLPAPWVMEAYDEYAKQYGRDQSLERLCERGGLGVVEIVSLLIDALARERAKR